MKKKPLSIIGVLAATAILIPAPPAESHPTASLTQNLSDYSISLPNNSTIDLRPCGLFDKITGVLEDEAVDRVREGIHKAGRGDKQKKSQQSSDSKQGKTQKLKFLNEFFPAGKLTTPAKPVLRYNGLSDNGDSINIWYNLPKEFIAMASAYEISQEKGESMNERFGVDDYSLFLQTDASIDNGSWLYTKAWDDPDWSGLDKPYFLAFQTSIKQNNGTQVFYPSAELSWLTYVEKNENAGFLAPIITAFTNSYGNTNYHYNLQNHTLAVRSRLVLKYTINGTTKCLFSDWSPVTSIGANGTQQPLPAPTSIATPSISSFAADGHYYLDIADSVYDGVVYCEAQANIFEPYSIQAQIRINGGNWTDVYTANPVWIFSGYRLATLSDKNISPSDNVEIRARLLCNNLGLASEWSNVKEMSK